MFIIRKEHKERKIERRRKSIEETRKRQKERNRNKEKRKKKKKEEMYFDIIYYCKIDIDLNNMK